MPSTRCSRCGRWRGRGGALLAGAHGLLVPCWLQFQCLLGSCPRAPLAAGRPKPTSHLPPALDHLQGALPGEHGGALPPTARGPAYADPTVTISTKAAFEAINAMFGGGSGSGMAAAPSQPAAQHHGSSDADGFRVPAPRPPRARPAVPAEPAASPGCFCIREDTQFVSVPLEPEVDSPGGSGGGFCIREDTQFITVPAAGADDEEDNEAAPMAAVAGSRAAAAPAASPGGFCIREDTQFITVAVHPEEEEEELQQHLDDQPAAVQPAAAPAAAPAPAFGGFSIREDTQFIGLGGASPSPSPESAAVLGGSGRSGGNLLPQKRPLGARDGSTGDLLGDHTGGSGGSPLDDASPMLSGGAVQVGLGDEGREGAVEMRLTGSRA